MLILLRSHFLPGGATDEKLRRILNLEPAVDRLPNDGFIGDASEPSS